MSQIGWLLHSSRAIKCRVLSYTSPYLWSVLLGQIRLLVPDVGKIRCPSSLCRRCNFRLGNCEWEGIQMRWDEEGRATVQKMVCIHTEHHSSIGVGFSVLAVGNTVTFSNHVSWHAGRWGREEKDLRLFFVSYHQHTMTWSPWTWKDWLKTFLNS